MAAAAKAKLEEMLRKIETASSAVSRHRVRRPYPKILPSVRSRREEAID
jgi:hypothetical protein